MAFLFIWLLIQITFSSLESITYTCVANGKCGCSVKSASSTKIVGGEIARVGTWGWAVSIRSRDNHFCGGSLISPELVITAAHCFAAKNPTSSLSVTAGSERLSSVKQKRSISKVYLHRNYDSRTYTNDIAVLRLSSSFDVKDSSLALICLPTDIKENNTQNASVIAIGWGVQTVGDEATSNALRQVTLGTVASNDFTCQKSIHDEKVQFCAGVPNGGKDTCQGDSGGPLMIFLNNRWHLIGITSYGKGCGLPGYPGIYTRVSAYEQSLNSFITNDLSGINRTFIIANSVSSIVASFYLNSFLFFIIYLFY